MEPLATQFAEGLQGSKEEAKGTWQARLELQGRRGVPVTLPLGAALLPPASQRSVAGEDLVQPPNILQGISPNGEVKKYALLTQDQELELIHQSRFYVAAADARRELLAASNAEELVDNNHEE